ncbi:MAG: GNAT family N-acetyltransferase [Clostridiales bacterium]|nr:GNAT family N-acetyltransferase [Clostridiales bacterium]
MEIRQFAESDIDYVISRHLDLYKAEYGFTSDIWKAYVADGVHQLAAEFDPERDCFHILEANGSPSGCIAIVHREGASAQLRFFFVEPSFRGQGAGNKLMDAAILFSREKGHERVFLWTFSKLHAARHLYCKHGFILTETHENTEWGEPVLEERWDLDLL